MNTMGFIGLGNMGAHMVRRLCKAGYAPRIYDTDSSKRAALEALGAVWLSSIQEVADHAATVIVSLPTPAVVADVVAGPKGLINGNAIRYVVDTSTTGPEVSKRVSQDLAAKSIHFIDAPVSGGTTGAEHGTLSIMASGSPSAYAVVRPALEQLGSKLFYLGGQAGQAQLMKVINNTICAAATLASFEGLVLGSKAGLDAQTMLDVINASSGRNFATEVKIPQCVVDRSFPMRFTTALLHKDVALCLDEAERQLATMSVSSTARQVLQQVISQGEGSQDYGTVITYYEKRANAQFGKTA